MEDPMSISGISKTQVDLDGLLSVLSENLYSSPAIVIRELIQNAQDACVRHQLEAGNHSSPYNIRILCNSQDHTITIIDNGSGLTASEIKDYLATIGSGYTRRLRQATQTQDMVGFFGLGFLSAYVVADKVEFETTSYQDHAKTWLFSSVKGKSFSISEVAQAGNKSSGSAVTLHLKKEFLGLSDPQWLTTLIEKYCCLLSLPIFINQSQIQVNKLIAPWESEVAPDEISQSNHSKRVESNLAFARAFESDYEPLWSFELPMNQYKVKGLIWIQDGTSYTSSDNRNASIFVRRMFITNEHKDILPNWAGFFGAVIESAHFQPTASRETLQKDEYYQNVQTFLKEQIVLKLRQLVLQESRLWQKIVDRHGQGFLGAALSDTRLFDVMKKLLKVPTTRGDMTILQVLKQSNNCIYLSNEEQYSYQEVLFNARMIPVVKGFLFGAAQFSRLYAQSESITLFELGENIDDKRIFPEVDVTHDVQLRLTNLLAKDDEKVLFTRFVPDFLPLVCMIDQQAKLKQSIESEKKNSQIGAAALSLARLHTKKIENVKIKKLYINMDNKLIDLLLSIDETKQTSLASLLRSYMDSTAQNQLKPKDDDNNFAQAMESFNQSILDLIKGDA